MRRMLLLSLATMMLALLLAGGVALAAIITFENFSSIFINDADPDIIEPAAASPYPSEIGGQRARPEPQHRGKPAQELEIHGQVAQDCRKPHGRRAGAPYRGSGPASRPYSL
jgi:hypothetical protein